MTNQGKSHPRSADIPVGPGIVDEELPVFGEVGMKLESHQAGLSARVGDVTQVEEDPARRGHEVGDDQNSPDLPGDVELVRPAWGTANPTIRSVKS